MQFYSWKCVLALSFCWAVPVTAKWLFLVAVPPEVASPIMEQVKGVVHKYNQELNFTNIEFLTISTDDVFNKLNSSTNIIGVYWTSGEIMEPIPMETNDGLIIVTENKDSASTKMSNVSLSIQPSARSYAKALITMATHLEYFYLQIVMDNSTYYREVLEILSAMSTENDLCITSVDVLEDDAEVYRCRLDGFLNQREITRVVLVLAQPNIARKIIEDCSRNKEHHYVFITDSFQIFLNGSVSEDTLYLTRYVSDIILPIQANSGIELKDMALGIDQGLSKIASAISRVLLNITENLNLQDLRKDFYNAFSEISLLKNNKLSWVKIADIDIFSRRLSFVKQQNLNTITSILNEPFDLRCRHNYLLPLKYAHSDVKDIYIAIVLPIHQKANNPSGCGDLNLKVALQALTFLYTIEQLNSQSKYNLTLGYVMIDSCEIPERVKYQFDFLHFQNIEISSRMAAVVGFPDSSDYIPLEEYFGSKHLPMFSLDLFASQFLSKSITTLNVKLSTSPKYDIRVLISFIQLANISHIGLIYEDVDEVKYFLQKTTTLNVSVSYVVQVRNMHTDEETVLSYIKQYLNETNVIVMLTKWEVLKYYVSNVKNKVIDEFPHDNANFTGILWLTRMRGNPKPIEDATENVIVMHSCTDLTADLVQYVENRIAINDSWVARLLSQCNNSISDQKCILQIIQQTFGLDLVVESMLAIKIVFEKHLQKVCPNNQNLCHEFFADPLQMIEDLEDINLDEINNRSIEIDSDYHFIRDYSIDIVDSNRIMQIGHWSHINEKIVFDSVTSAKVFKKIQVNPKCNVDKNCKINQFIFNQNVYVEPGELMIYVFLNLGLAPHSDCPNVINSNGYQNFEAIRWSLNESNAKAMKTINKTFGILVADTCGKPNITHDILTGLMNSRFYLKNFINLPHNYRVIGIIGGDTAADGKAIAEYAEQLGLNVPTILLSSFDGWKNYDVFLTSHSREHSHIFALKLIKYLNWNTIHLITDNTETSKQFQRILENSEICVASSVNVDQTWTNRKWFEKIRDLQNKAGINGIIFTLESVNFRTFYQVLYNMDALNDFFYILPKEFNLMDAVSKSTILKIPGLTTVEKEKDLNNLFGNYYILLDKNAKNDNPWYNAFRISQMHRCDSKCKATAFSKEIQTEQSTEMANALFVLVESYKKSLQSYRDDEIFYGTTLKDIVSTIKIYPQGGSMFSFHAHENSARQKVLNVQVGPGGTNRLYNVGTFQNEQLTIDSKKINFYQRGIRIWPVSACIDDCIYCMNQTLVNSYNNIVAQFVTAGPEFHHKFIDALGVATILLDVITIMAVILASYYFRQFYSHKIWHLYADADLGILMGAIVMVASTGVFMMSTIDVICSLQIMLPCLSYSIVQTSLLIKLVKIKCFSRNMGFNLRHVPRWDFGMVFIPPVLCLSAVLYSSWVMGNYTSIIHEVTPISDFVHENKPINIYWKCQFDIKLASIQFSGLWAITLESLIASISCACLNSDLLKLREIVWSTTVIFFAVSVISLVLLVSQNVEAYCILCSVTSPLIASVVIYLNFTPSVLKMMQEKQKEDKFYNFMMTEKSQRLAKLWTKSERPIKQISDAPRSGRNLITNLKSTSGWLNRKSNSQATDDARPGPSSRVDSESENTMKHNSKSKGGDGSGTLSENSKQKSTGVAASKWRKLSKT